MNAVLFREGALAFAAEADRLSTAESAGTVSGGAVPQFLADLRAQGLTFFREKGFPTTRDEEWRYFDTSTLRSREWPGPDGPPPVLASRSDLRKALERIPAAGLGRSHRVVLVDGRLEPSLSTLDGLPDGVRFEPLSRVLRQDPERVSRLLGLSGAHRRHPIAALNAALFLDGAVLTVPPGVVVSEPFALVHVADGMRGGAAHPRLLVHAGENSQATVIEAYCGAGAESFTNGAAELFLGPHASLDHYKLQEEDEGAVHVGTTDAHLASGSQLFSHVLSLGGGHVRNEMSAQLHGEGAGLTIDGLFLARGDQRVDNHVVVDHGRPHGGSQQLFKGIVDARARGAFVGRIVVRPHAVKTDAHQKSRNLVLSREALIDTKPQLEIYNDDVKCTHGSATGRLDDDALFYLRARGIGELEARSLLTYAFAAEITGRVKVGALREHLEKRVLEWLPGEGGTW